ncbi:MAG: DUF1015 domain-containing protein [Clostridia bacterium]|nr:DUF1015 domain-containing protein [Clostridia bacterium]
MNKRCFVPADILIPEGVDMTKWSVVACDQYTSEPEYWENVDKNVGDAPSALRISLPEIYLGRDDTADRVSKINRTMEEYGPLFKEYKSSMIYVERTFKTGKVRRGIVGAVDLEEYDFSKDSVSLIRATEGTVLERIPPRVAVREKAPLEMPHIMILADDPGKTIIEPIASKKDTFTCVYDFELMEDGGHIKGWLIPEKEIDTLTLAYEKLADTDLFNKEHGTNCGSPLLFAMGDGNHSLATAKTCYENLKKAVSAEEALASPARFALCELVNLHDDSLEFEAIHRVVFGTDAEKLVSEFKKYCKENPADNEAQSFIIYYGENELSLTIENPPFSLAAGTLQHFLDEYIKANGGKIDYVHGDDVVKRLGSEKGNIGILLPAMPKSALFKSVAQDGVLPRKTFSMGEACEKRFYLECRKIK